MRLRLAVALGLLVGVATAYDVPLCQHGRVHPGWALPKGQGVGEDYQLYNSDRSPNVFCLNQSLVVETRLTSFAAGNAYSSGMLVLREPLGYGTLRVTAQLPKGKGLFPQISLMPYDAMYGTRYQCAYPVHGDCLAPTNGAITLASTINDGAFLPLIQNLHLGLPGTPSYPSPPEDHFLVGDMGSDWWERPHVWELHRTAAQLALVVDGVETLLVEADDLRHFLEDHRAANEGVDHVYGDVPLAPFDDANPFQLLVHTAVGGRLPCGECDCCPVDRRFPLLNTTINDRPYSRLVIHAVAFTPLQPHSRPALYLPALLLPVLALAVMGGAPEWARRWLPGWAGGWGRRPDDAMAVSTARPHDYGSALPPTAAV